MEVNKVYCGKMEKVLLEICPDNFCDSIVTDPPYGLKFMGKHWDYDVPTVEQWKEAYRVLKPGGFLLAFGGTRTYHRMVVNIEDAGFEIRDQIQWLYGSGFPKSLDISKAIDKAAGAVRTKVIGKSQYEGRRPNDWGGDKNGNNCYGDYNAQPEMPIYEAATDEAKEWEGWGTALKPANEPICVARKPVEGTVAANVLKYGTGGINIDGCRVEVDKDIDASQLRTMNRSKKDNNGWGMNSSESDNPNVINEKGRFPANVILDEFIDTIFILDEKISVDLQELIKKYYDRNYVSGMQECLQDLSKQVERWKGEILQQTVLSQSPIRKDEGRKAPIIWEGAFGGINTENEKVQKAERERSEQLQGTLPIERVQIHPHSRTVGSNVKNGEEDAFKGREFIAGTQINDGCEFGEAAKSIRTRTPQKRCEGRQQDEQLGGDGQLYTQDRTQEYIKRIAQFEEAKRGFIVFGSELPDLFKSYFTETLLTTQHFNSPKFLLDKQSGNVKSGGKVKGTEPSHAGGNTFMGLNRIENIQREDEGGASRFFYCPKPDNFERNKGLKNFEAIPTASSNQSKAELKRGNTDFERSDDNATGWSSVKMKRNHHPTVKPIDLMRYLVRLVTRKGGICLDPFCGSGTTLIAAKMELMNYVGIDMDETHIPLAEARVKLWNPDLYKPQTLF